MPTVVARLFAALLATLAVGTLAAVAARLLMRVLALAFDEGTEFTVAGSVIIIVIFAMLLTPAALGGALALGRGGWWAALRWFGVLVSAGVLLTTAGGTALSDGVEVVGDLTPGWRTIVAVTLAVFAGVIVGGALAAARLGARWSWRFAQAPAPSAAALVA